MKNTKNTISDWLDKYGCKDIEDKVKLELSKIEVINDRETI
jgi:hypothetical protein